MNRPRNLISVFSLVLLLLGSAASQNPGRTSFAAQQPKAGAVTLGSPTDPRDLVVFIANNQPSLHRIVGSKAIPFGSVKFENPDSIVADPKGKCFYVLDKPRLLADKVKIWQVSPEGAGTIVFAGHYVSGGGPFNSPLSLGLDRQGRVLIADASTGLWRLENGRLVRIFDGKDKPLHIITAATEHPERGLLVGTSYQYAITGGEILDLPTQRFRDDTWSPAPSYGTWALEELGYVNNLDLNEASGAGNSTGRQVPIRIWKNQGGLYLVDISSQRAKVSGFLVNQKPDGQEFETYWRTLTQVMVDSAGRVLLVDWGSQNRRVESSYISPGVYSSTPRVTTLTINGGVFVIHPDGRFEDLTFKTPANNSGPMRHPVGIAQWSSDTYIIADPELYAEGINGTGGLMLLGLDGKREARWALGARLKPSGVAILRGAGSPAAVAEGRPIVLTELAGDHIAGSITRVDKVSWERKPPADPRDLLASIRPWQAQPAEEATKTLRSLFEGSRWSIGADGSLVLSARGVDPAQQGTPLVMRGKIVPRGDLANATTSYFRPGDLQIGSMDAEIQMLQPGVLSLQLNVTVYTNNDRIKATFELTMPIRDR